MYEAEQDPYCYPGTHVLKNRLGLQNQAALDAFEAEITAQRAAARLSESDGSSQRQSITVITGPREARVPVIPIRRTWCLPKRDGRVKPGHDNHR
jgi:hypothetical protein